MVDVLISSTIGTGEEVSLPVELDVVVLRGNASSCEGPSSNVCLVMVGYALLVTANLVVSLRNDWLVGRARSCMHVACQLVRTFLGSSVSKPNRGEEYHSADQPKERMVSNEDQVHTQRIRCWYRRIDSIRCNGMAHHDDQARGLILSDFLRSEKHAGENIIRSHTAARARAEKSEVVSFSTGNRTFLHFAWHAHLRPANPLSKAAIFLNNYKKRTTLDITLLTAVTQCR